ncbi:hypothetical protein I3760_01G019900 [Carya illinoinensis]|nr:hypothetical protein I3760_01G019900 [Carya illinoinensis]
MANAACTCLFFLMIIFCHEFVLIEGRNVKPWKVLKCVKCLSPDTKGVATVVQPRKIIASQSPSYLPHGIKTSNGYVGAFRPTTPGHSPGVGH